MLTLTLTLPVGLPLVLLLLLLPPAVHFSPLLPAAVHPHHTLARATTTRLSAARPDTTFHAGVAASAAVLSDVMELLSGEGRGFEHRLSTHPPPHPTTTRPTSGERSVTEVAGGRGGGVGVEAWYALQRDGHAMSPRSVPDNGTRRGGHNQTTGWSHSLLFSTLKDSWHRLLDTHRRTLVRANAPSSLLYRPKRSLTAFPYHDAVNLNDVTNHVQLSGKPSSSHVDPALLKRRLQNIYRLFLTDETADASDVFQDSASEFVKRGNAQVMGNDQTDLNRQPEADNGLAPTVFSQSAHTQSPENSRQGEIIAEEQPMDPYLIEYLETVGSFSTSHQQPSTDVRTETGRWVGSDLDPHGGQDEEEEEEEEEESVNDLPQSGADVSRGLGQGELVVIHRRRKPSRAQEVRRLYDPNHLGPLARFTLPHKGRGRQGKAKKHPVPLHRHLDKTRPLKPLSHKTASSTKNVRECRRGESAKMTCPSDVRVCLSDVMICDGVRNCRYGEDESPFLCMMRLWAFTLFNNVHSIFNTFVTPQSRDAPRHQSRDHRHDSLYRQ